MSPAVILAAIEGVMKLIDLINKIRANNDVTAAWTPEQRAAIDDRWAELQNSPAWQTDAEKGQ